MTKPTTQAPASVAATAAVSNPAGPSSNTRHTMDVSRVVAAKNSVAPVKAAISRATKRQKLGEADLPAGAVPP